MKLPWPLGSKDFVGPDDFTFRADDRYAEEHRLLNGWLTHRVPRLGGFYESEARSPVYQKLIGLRGRARGRVAVALLQRCAHLASVQSRSGDWSGMYWAYELLTLASDLVRGKDSLTPEDLPHLIDAWIKLDYDYGFTSARVAGLLEAAAKQYGLTDQVKQLVNKVRMALKRVDSNPPTVAQRKVGLRLNAILNPGAEPKLDLTEGWQKPFADHGSQFEGLLFHAASAKGPVPSQKWLTKARDLVQELHQSRFLSVFDSCIDEIRKMAQPVDPFHADMLRGLAWLSGLAGGTAVLAKLGLACAHKIPGIGVCSVKGFSGAIWALEQMGGFDSLAALSQIKNKVKAPLLGAQAVGALERAARSQGLPMEELEELVVPTFGLGIPGVRREQLGDVTASVEVEGGEVALRWFRRSNEIKSAPTDVKNTFGEELRELRQTTKEAGLALSAQKQRLDGLLMSGRILPYSQWRERYIDHPLIAQMARRLIWRFDLPGGERLGIALNGDPVDVEGKLIEGLSDDVPVRLWHPIEAGASAIEAWREFLIDREIRQPFKQAHREVYVLTEAELRTNTYSNRFAAHILKQHQMAALMRQRGWRYGLQGWFDFQSTPTKDLPKYNLRVEFLVDVPDMGSDDNLMTEAGISLYIGTDQVRFFSSGGEPVGLARIPQVVFSEIMRDVDLFVGVASVGNDPAWHDQGERLGYGGYWRQVSFGDLSATAQTRKKVLEWLLPRLSIASRASIKDKFLVVEGKMRIYKIHLGSGNILMEPNDQYLCIVPGRGAGGGKEKVFLPFEGDSVLAVILSKAFMLAEDHKITDRTITMQLKG